MKFLQLSRNSTTKVVTLGNNPSYGDKILSNYDGKIISKLDEFIECLPKARTWLEKNGDFVDALARAGENYFAEVPFHDTKTLQCTWTFSHLQLKTIGAK
jgi:hypothetical protein